MDLIFISYIDVASIQLSQIGPATCGQLAAAAAQKLADRESQPLCCQDITLMPVVAETFGGGGRFAQKVFNFSARAPASGNCTTVGVGTTRLHQGPSTIVMRANVRSMLARVSRGDSFFSGPSAHNRARATL